ncbi:MAG: PQQ-binding-like beta-propeller repeat protein [Phycisphaerae bacterium]
MRTFVWTTAGAAVVLLVSAAPAAGADWPQFRGPSRDGISPETDLARTWPDGGPPPVLTLSGLGEGWSSPVVAGDRILATGTRSGYFVVFCFDLAGRPVWRAPCGRAYEGSYPGARSTPTVAGGRVYVLSGRGLLTALTLDAGRKAWMVNIFDRFRGHPPRFGVAESVLATGGRVICTPGGAEGTLAALDAATGSVVWTSRGVDEAAGHASPIEVTWRGRRQIVTLTHKGLVGVAAEDGRLLWRHAKGFGWMLHENTMTPVFRDGLVFAEGGHRSGGVCVRLVPDGDGFAAQPVWTKPEHASHTGGYVERSGHLYGGTGRGWGCIDMASGEERWREPAIRRAATLWADARFYCVGEKGTVCLVDAGPDGCTVAGRFEIPNAGAQTWAYPALADGRLYVRRKDHVYVYDVSAKE